MDDKATATATLSERVAEELRALLARRRLSGRQLAEQLGVSRSWVSYRLTGSQEIGLNDLQRIAEALNVQVIDLMPRPEEGRVIATAGSPNQRSGAATRRLRHRNGRTSTKPRLHIRHPIGRPETETTAPAPAGSPVHRRPGLVSHRPQA